MKCKWCSHNIAPWQEIKEGHVDWLPPSMPETLKEPMHTSCTMVRARFYIKCADSMMQDAAKAMENAKYMKKLVEENLWNMRTE
jgi:hypothetical protein